MSWYRKMWNWNCSWRVIRKALIEATEDSSGVEQLKQEALAGYDIFKASDDK